MTDDSSDTWEEVYRQGRQCNRYPNDRVVSFLLSRFAPQQRPGSPVLDLGFGAGNHLWFAAREGFPVAGIEGSAQACHLAAQRLAAEGLSGDLHNGNFRKLPWPDNTFAAVVDRGSLCCNPPDLIADCLDEVRRVLRPGGRLLSLIYSDRHPERLLGRQRPDGGWDGFSSGYFKDLGIISFLSEQDVRTLYGTRFTLAQVFLYQHHSLGDDGDLTPCNASWNIEAVHDRA